MDLFRSSRLIRAAGVGLVAVLALGIPATARADRGALQYPVDRFNDLCDIFRVRAGVPKEGRAAGLKARVTALAQIGYVSYDGYYAGLDRRGFGIAEEDREEGGISLLYGSKHEMAPKWGNEFWRGDSTWSVVEDRHIIRNLPYWDDGRGDVTGIGAEVATPILALDLGVYPAEAVDFVTGFLLIDPYNDDQLFEEKYYPRERRVPSTPAEPDLKAATRRKVAELDAVKAEMEVRQLQESGQLEGEAQTTSPAESDAEHGTTAPSTAEDKPLTKERLDAIESNSTEVKESKPQ